MNLKRAAVVIGRFNPPTLGHYKVFDIVKSFIKQHPDLLIDVTPIVVVIEGKKTSEDKNRNPLTGDERVKFMQSSGRADGIKFLIASNANEAFQKVRDLGFEITAFAVGADRADSYGSILTKYFKDQNGKSVKRYQIELPRSGTDTGAAEVLKFVDKDIPVNMISSTLAREAAKQDQLDKFLIITGLTDKVELGTKMFNAVKKAMTNGS